MDIKVDPEETREKKSENSQPKLQTKECYSEISSCFKMDHPASVHVSSPSSCDSASYVSGTPLLASSPSNLDDNQNFEFPENDLEYINLHQQLTEDDHSRPKEQQREVNQTHIDNGVPKPQLRFEASINLTKISGVDSSRTNGESKSLEEQVFPAEGVGEEGEKKTCVENDTHQPNVKHIDANQLSDTDAESSNGIVACGGLEEQTKNPASSSARVPVVETQAAVHEKSTEVISDQKQTQEPLELGRKNFSGGNSDPAGELVTNVYSAPGSMTGSRGDNVVSEGYDTSSDLFVPLGTIGAKIRRFYRDVEHRTDWEPNDHFVKAARLWGLIFRIYLPFCGWELELLLQEFETISENLEKKHIWDRCLAVSSDLFRSYQLTDCYTPWSHDSLIAGMKRSALRMAVCTYEMKDFQSAIANCKFVLEELSDYDCFTALLLWTSSLREMKKYDTALKKAECALDCCRSTEDRQNIQSLISELQQKLKQQEEQKEDNSSEWLIGTNIGKDEEERQRAEEAKSRHLKRSRRHRPKRREKSPETIENNVSKTLSVEGHGLAKFSTPEALKFSQQLSPQPTKIIYDRSSSNKEGLRNELDISSLHSEKSTPVQSRNTKRERRQRHLSKASTCNAGNIVTSSNSHNVTRQRSISLNIENEESVHWSESEDENINSSSDNIY